VDELLQLLREEAADLGDFTTPPPNQDFMWTVDTNTSTTRVTAVTRKLSPDPEDAWRTATQLRDAIVALGYKLHGTCQVGVVSEIGHEDPSGPTFQLPICGWRGHVSLIFTTAE
jgi:hypothetical protein